MSFILQIETATTNCSVSLSNKGKLITSKEQNSTSYSHAEQLHPYIEEVLNSANVSLKDLDAVAVSMGPGSYTGLRIGVSATKGLCYALEIPMIAISTLCTLANTISENKVVIPIIDARRMDAYTAVYKNGKQVRGIKAETITENSFKTYYHREKTIIIGNCIEKCTKVLQHIHLSFISHYPSAIDMGTLAYQKYLNKDFVDVAYFEPYYLKDFVAGKPKKNF